MKLRMHGDSLRLRLSPEEISQLATEGRLADAVHIGSGDLSALAYELISSADHRAVDVELGAGLISVYVPADEVADWTGTDRVGIEAVVANTTDGLRVVLEKDWQCLTPRVGEDEAHLYPNPLAPDQ
ncbi:MAG: hypothetical protein OEM67_07170 [Thermoleophilia bacterium]|nr:hypothetical protein [Thermoleophilia bacterium]MDH3724861.1 hypothetical protein [Thermoleophilia bacterium]